MSSGETIFVSANVHEKLTRFVRDSEADYLSFIKVQIIRLCEKGSGTAHDVD